MPNECQCHKEDTKSEHEMGHIVHDLQHCVHEKGNSWMQAADCNTSEKKDEDQDCTEVHHLLQCHSIGGKLSEHFYKALLRGFIKRLLDEAVVGIKDVRREEVGQKEGNEIGQRAH